MKIKKYVSIAIIQLCLIVAISVAETKPGAGQAYIECCGANCQIHWDGEYTLNGICYQDCYTCHCNVLRASDNTWLEGTVWPCPGN